MLSEVIIDAYTDLVRTSNFNELKGIVKELAQAQKESQKEINRLDNTVQGLAEAQRRTEASLNRLIERTDVAEKRLEGISNSVGYSTDSMI